jgi:hypothetical protein
MVYTRNTKRRLLKLFQRELFHQLYPNSSECTNSYLEEKYAIDTKNINDFLENKQKHAEFSCRIIKLCCSAKRARNFVDGIKLEAKKGTCVKNLYLAYLTSCQIHIHSILEELRHLYFLVNNGNYPTGIPQNSFLYDLFILPDKKST